MVINVTYTFNKYADMMAVTADNDEVAYCVETLSYYTYNGSWTLRSTIVTHSTAIRVADSEILDEANVLAHSTAIRIANSELLDEANVLAHSTSARTQNIESKGGACLFHGVV